MIKRSFFRGLPPVFDYRIESNLPKMSINLENVRIEPYRRSINWFLLIDRNDKSNLSISAETWWGGVAELFVWITWCYRLAASVTVFHPSPRRLEVGLRLDRPATKKCLIIVFCFCLVGDLLGFFLLVSHLRLSQWKDDIVVGWLIHFIVITLYQQQPNGSTRQI